MLRESPSKAGLLQALLAALFLAAPGAALADDECGLQVGTTPVDCGDASYSSGVTYDAVGDLFIDFTNGGVTTIGTSADGDGIDLNAAGIDDITFDSATTATEIQALSGMEGALLSVTTADGAIDIDTEEMDADGVFNAPNDITHAIRAVSGSGDIDINTTGAVDAQGTNPADSVGIEAVSDSGDVNVTTMVDDSFGAVSGNQSAIKIDTGGDAEINVLSGNVQTGLGGTVLDLNVAGQTVINNSGTIRIANSNSEDFVMRAAGGSLEINNNGTIESGALDLSGLTEGYVFNNNAGAIWGLGNGLNVGRRLPASQLGTGILNNAGTIRMAAGDSILAQGTTFTASGDSLLEMTRTALDGRSQLDCTAPTEAGCIDLSGGSTSGQTRILVRAGGGTVDDPFTDSIDKPVSAGIVLIDVGGGTTQADHFALDPGSDNYTLDSKYGAVIDAPGLFDYTLLYNPNTQQHLLASVPQHEALEYAAFIHEALSIWHTTSDAVAGRQADLRDGGERGGWVRVVSEETDRDFRPTVTTHGNTFTYDRSYSLATRTIIAGYDLRAGDDYVFGIHGGLISTKLEHDNSETRDETKIPSLSSATVGVYGGRWYDSGLTLDGTFNLNLLDLQHEVRDDLEGSKTNVISVGVRAEAGWRFPVAETFYVQPLITAAYVYADVEDLSLRDYEAKFEDTQSTRAALGVRLGGSTDLTDSRFSRVKYWLTARAWEEYAEDGNVQFATGGDPLVIEDDISESFEEVGLGVSLTSPDENLEVFLSGNVRSGDHTDGNNVTVGARLNW